MFSSRLPLLLLVVALLAACSTGGEPPAATTVTTSTAIAPTSTVPASTTLPPSTTTSPTSGTTESEAPAWVLEPALDRMPDAWELAFSIGYGAGDEFLGTAPGGDGGLMLGPEYGAQAPDGTWWFLDAAKRRIAHYDGSGGYLDAVVLGDDLLAGGQYFQFQLPRVLADGTLVATRLDLEATHILRVLDGEASIVDADVAMAARADDGSLIYGYGAEGGSYVIDPRSGLATATEFFATQTGRSYRVTMGDSELVVELPDEGIEHRIPLSSTLGPEPVHAGLEVASGADGSLHVFLLGISEADESVQLAGFGTIRPDGSVSELEPIMDPFTPADPGSPARLGTGHGSSTATFMVVGEQGVDVYVRR